MQIVKMTPATDRMKKLIYLLIIVGAAFYFGRAYLPQELLQKLPLSLQESASTDSQQVSQSPSKTLKEGDIDPQTGQPLVKCSRCRGAGSFKCNNPRCNDGWVNCPGPCLKKNVGPWQRMKVDGHSDDEVWQKFPNKTGSGWHAWNLDHVGEVIEYRDGKAENIGKCKTCGGTSKIACATCGQTGKLTCTGCQGKGVVPVSAQRPSPAKASISPVPVAAAQPESPLELFKLKDGTTIEGRVVIRESGKLWLRTKDGKSVQIPISKLR